jgi:hypothetical protein
MRRTVFALLMVGSVVSLVTGLATAQGKKPDATLTLSEGSVGVGIGYTGARGP